MEGGQGRIDALVALTSELPQLESVYTGQEGCAIGPSLAYWEKSTC